MSTVAPNTFPNSQSAISPAAPWTRPIISFVAAAVYGAALWGSAPIWAGKKEPWDSAFGLYMVALTLGGLMGAMAPRRPWAAPAGLVIGQVAWQIGSGAGSLWPLAMIVLTILALPAAAVATGVWLIDRHRGRRGVVGATA